MRPTNKVYAIFIICGALIAVVWLLNRQAPTPTPVTENAVTIKASENNTELDTEWQKILTETNPDATRITSLIKTGEETFDETTVTAQVARDFLAQYLLFTKQGTPMTSETADTIASNVISAPGYTITKAPVYIEKNLHVILSANKNDMLMYSDKINDSLRDASAKIKVDPISVVSSAIQSEDEKKLSQLDPIIIAGKGLIADFLRISVPKSAVSVHLKVLNAFSAATTGIESLKGSINDPVKALISLGQYQTNMQNVSAAISEMNLFLRNNK